MTFSSVSEHGNSAGIPISLQKGTTSKGMEKNRNFGKWLSYGRGISGELGAPRIFLMSHHRILL